MGSTGKSTSTPTLQTYQKMSVNDAANFVFNTPDNTDPELNTHNKYQDVVNALNLHKKPIVVDDKTFDKQYKSNALDGVALYRGIGNQEDTAVMYSIKFGDKFYVGAGMYGGGLYFTDLYQDAEVGYSNGDEKTSILTAYIDKNKAKPVEYATIYKEFSNEPIATQKLFAKDDSTSGVFDDPIYLQGQALSAYAMYKGYNVIRREVRDYKGNLDGYHYIALTRDILVFRDNTPKGGVK